MTIQTNELYLNLLQLLCSKQTNSEQISGALKMTCETYEFDAGYVYDLSHLNKFVLKEHYESSSNTNICEEFSLQDISKNFYDKLAKQPLLFVPEKADYTADEVALLNIFAATSLCVTSIIDDDACMYGMVFFVNYSKKELWPQEQTQMLEIAFSILTKSLTSRCMQNKTLYAQKTLEGILDNTGIDIYAIDFYNQDILYANKSMTKPYGGIEQFHGHKCWEVLFPGQNGICEFCPQKHLIDEEGNPSKVYVWDYQRSFDGSWFRVFSAAFRWIDGRLAHVVSSADITDNKRNEELIQYMANYDSLTNLPNRRNLVNECEKRIASDNRNGFVLFFDIDKFKCINDQYGHESGDEFLVQLGAFFTNIPILKDNIYRNGGDEFVALIDADYKKEDLIRLSHFIHERFSKPWKLAKGDVYCDVSIGVACYPEDGTTAEILINKADQAMYQVKAKGGGNISFAHELKQKN